MMQDGILVALGALFLWWGAHNVRAPMRERRAWLADWTPEKDRYRRDDIAPPYWPRLSGYFMLLVAGLFSLWFGLADLAQRCR